MADGPSRFSGLLSLLAWLSFQKFCWNGINNISCRHRATWSHTSPNKSRSLSTLYIHDDTAATTTTSITANSFFLPSPPSSTVENIDVGYIWYNIDADDDRKLRRETNMWWRKVSIPLLVSSSDLFFSWKDRKMEEPLHFFFYNTVVQIRSNCELSSFVQVETEYYCELDQVCSFFFAWKIAQQGSTWLK